jgi:hypothetical protein
VVISGAVGRRSVKLAAEVYDRASAADIGQALSDVGKQLLQNVPTKNFDAIRGYAETPRVY